MKRFIGALIAQVALLSCTADSPPPEPAIEVGYMLGGEFHAYEEGASINAMRNLQAGVWFMPSIRFTGMTGEPSLSCHVVNVQRDFLFAEKSGFFVSHDRGDGWQTVSPYLIEVLLPDQDLDDNEEVESYVGDLCQLECSVIDDDGNAAVATYDMRIAAP